MFSKKQLHRRRLWRARSISELNRLDRTVKRHPVVFETIAAMKMTSPWSILCSPPHAPASPPRVKPTVTKGSTKAELLSRAKAAIEAGESFLRDAAEALALAQKAFNASQREIAEAIGRSASWVNRLLKWRRSGYKEYSPFGPTTKAGRVAHAQQQAKASKLRKPEATTTKTPADAETSSSSVDAETSTSRKPSPAEAKRNLMYAIRRWWPYMDHAGKVEITAFFLKQKGVPASGAIDLSRASSAIS